MASTQLSDDAPKYPFDLAQSAYSVIRLTNILSDEMRPECRVRDDGLKSMHTILVVAHDEELRRSIAFALEAEGLAVSCRADLASAAEIAAISAFGCAVVDEDAMCDVEGAWETLSRMMLPVILLIDHLRATSGSPTMRLLNKPLLGRHLVEAVLSSLAIQEGPRPIK